MKNPFHYKCFKKTPLRWLSIVIALSCAPMFCKGQKPDADGRVTVSGLITPRDDSGMYLRGPDGEFEVTWTNQTLVALEANTRQFSGLKPQTLEYKIHSSREVLEFKWPDGPITGIKTLRNERELETALEEAKNEKWISEHGLKLYFNQAPKKEQLASADDLRFIGSWKPFSKPRVLGIGNTDYEISLKKGGQTNALLFNLLTTEDVKPFVNRATAIGRREGDVIIADEIHVLPIGDQTANDDPNLPRYLFIGDSISGNYDRGLREALSGKLNIHHPPTNCGPTRKGRESIQEWLGGYKQEGRHWDVISFNFGHWDAGNDQQSYQENLEAIIVELKKTGAKLIWVTTCPVPKGFPPAQSLLASGKAPSRTSGVMEKFLNPWAAEVIARHPEITICDQWQFVKNGETGLYKEWWQTKDVHFGGELADALGQFLAEHVAEVMSLELENPVDIQGDE